VSSSSAEDDFVVGGYLPDYRTYININATAPHLTDLMLFSLTPESVLQFASPESGKGSEVCCLSSDHYELIRKAKSYKREQKKDENLRLIVTVGGGERSKGFVDVVIGSTHLQEKFVKGLVKVCQSEELDGIDLDFEGIHTIEQWKAYLHFISYTAEHLHKKNLVVTVALHPGQFLPSNICKNVDRVHLMTYDMQPSSDDKRNHHATFASMQQAIKRFTHKKGCDASKVVIGIPAYGRSEQNFVKTYSEMIDEQLGSDSDNSDVIKKVPESLQSLHLHTWNGFHFDSLEDVRRKVQYAKRQGLKGVFLWELGQDRQLEGVADGGILLETMSSAAFGNNENEDRKEEL